MSRHGDTTDYAGPGPGTYNVLGLGYKGIPIDVYIYRTDAQTSLQNSHPSFIKHGNKNNLQLADMHVHFD